MPFALANPKKSLQISFITMLFSVVGGIAAYFIGLLFWDSFGDRILALLHLQSKFDDFLVFAQKWQNLAVLIAGVTPLPFKVVTLSAGALKFNLPLFILFSFIARSIMFMVPGILIYIFGEKAKEIIDKNFKILTIIGAVALVVIVWWVSKGHA